MKFPLPLFALTILSLTILSASSTALAEDHTTYVRYDTFRGVVAGKPEQFQELSGCYRFREPLPTPEGLIPVQECPQRPVVAQCTESLTEADIYYYRLQGVGRDLRPQLEACIIVGGKWDETPRPAPPKEQALPWQAGFALIAKHLAEALKENDALKAEIAILKAKLNELRAPRCLAHGGVASWINLQHARCVDGTED